MMQALPFVSVIIPVYNDPERLEICLRALDKQTYPLGQYEVIVVDNGSDEGIEAIVEQFPKAVAAFEERSGSYAARNKGLSLARGKLLAFTDSDCIPASNWIERGVKAFLSVSNCGIVGGKIEFFFQNPANPKAFEIWDSMTYLNQEEYIKQRKNSVTANLFTSRQIVDLVGEFDAELKSLGDHEWGVRVYSAGYQLLYADDVLVAHPARGTFRAIHRRMLRTAKGFADVNLKQKTPPAQKKGWERIKKLLPSMETFTRIWKHHELSLRKKISVTCVGIVMKYVESWEKWRAQHHK